MVSKNDLFFIIGPPLSFIYVVIIFIFLKEGKFMKKNYDDFWLNFYEAKRFKARKDEDYDSEDSFNKRFESNIDNKELAMEILSYLKNIDQSYKDFKEIVSDYELRIFENFSQEYFYTYNEKNVRKLKEMCEEEKRLANKEGVHILNAIMIARLINNLDPTFKIDEDLKDYLRESLDPVKNWGIYELNVFGNTVGVLDIETTYNMGKKLMKRTDYFISSFKNKQMLIRVFLNLFSNFTEQDCLEKAKIFMDHLATLMTKNDRLLFEHLILRYIKGFYLFKMGEKNKGIQLMEHSIAIMEEMEYEVMAENYRESLKELIGEK